MLMILIQQNEEGFVIHLLISYIIWLAGEKQEYTLHRHTHTHTMHLHSHASGQVGDQLVTMVARKIPHRGTVY